MSAKVDKSEDKKRSEITPGIYMDKLREKVGDVSYYVIKVELKLFQVLEITIDFRNSKNLKVENSDELVIVSKVQPFEYKEVARLILGKSWNLKTKVSFTISLPEIDVQRKFISGFVRDIEANIKAFSTNSQMDFVRIPEKNLLLFLQTKQTDFVDLDFLPNYESIGMTESQCADQFESLVHWKRLREIVQKEDGDANASFAIMSFEGPPHPIDVKLGRLDNNQCLSALAASSEVEGRLDKALFRKQDPKSGFIKVKLFNMGVETDFILDDFFPCYPLGLPLFGCNQSNSSWVLYLEKALAKKYHSYNNLKRLNYLNTVVDITGLPTFHTSFDESGVRTLSSQKESLWQFLLQSYGQRFIIAADTLAQKTDTKDAKEISSQTGCLIVKVAEHEGVRLVNFRNQFGVFDWEGDWSATSPLWTEATINAFLPDLSGEDETLWMSFDDFVRFFDGVNVTKNNLKSAVGMHGLFITSMDQENPTVHHFCSQHYYEFELKEPQKLTFGIHQEDCSFSNLHLSRPFIDLGMAVLKRNKGSYRLAAFTDSEVKRQVFLEAVLEQGQYMLVPMSSGLNLKSRPASPFAIKSFDSSDKQLQLLLIHIFQKLDRDSDGLLSYEELVKFYKKVGQKLTEENYNVFLNIYSKKNADVERPKGFTLKHFMNHFFELIGSAEEAGQVFSHFGLDFNNFSFRSRVFGVTVHATDSVRLIPKDALNDNVDYVCQKLILKLYGQEIEHLGDQSFAGDSIAVPSFYLNKCHH